MTCRYIFCMAMVIRKGWCCFNKLATFLCKSTDKMSQSWKDVTEELSVTARYIIPYILHLCTVDGITCRLMGAE